MPLSEDHFSPTKDQSVDAQLRRRLAGRCERQLDPQTARDLYDMIENLDSKRKQMSIWGDLGYKAGYRQGFRDCGETAARGGIGKNRPTAEAAG